jgi:hypothetical protein
MELRPQSASFTIDSRSFSDVADVLARESAADEVNGFEVVVSNVSDIFVSPYVRPVLLKNLEAIWINLYLPRTFHPRTFKTKIEAADSREQRTESHGPLKSARRLTLFSRRAFPVPCVERCTAVPPPGIIG